MKRKILVVALICGMLGSSYAFDSAYSDDFEEALDFNNSSYDRFRSSNNRFTEANETNYGQNFQQNPSYNKQYNQSYQQSQSTNQVNQPWQQNNNQYSYDTDNYYKEPVYNNTQAQSPFYNQSQTPINQTQKPNQRRQSQFSQDQYSDNEDDYVINTQTGKKMYLKDLKNSYPQANSNFDYSDEVPLAPASNRNYNKQSYRQPEATYNTATRQYQEKQDTYFATDNLNGPTNINVSYNPSNKEAQNSQGYADRAMGRTVNNKLTQNKQTNKRKVANPFRFFQRMNPFR